MAHRGENQWTRPGSFVLWPAVCQSNPRNISNIKMEKGTTDSKGMDHGLETEVDLLASNDLGDIRRVIGLEDGDLDALVLEVSLLLGEVKGGVVGRSMPSNSYFSSSDTTQQQGNASIDHARRQRDTVAIVLEPTSW